MILLENTSCAVTEGPPRVNQTQMCYKPQCQGIHLQMAEVFLNDKDMMPNNEVPSPQSHGKLFNTQWLLVITESQQRNIFSRFG